LPSQIFRLAKPLIVFTGILYVKSCDSIWLGKNVTQVEESCLLKQVNLLDIGLLGVALRGVIETTEAQRQTDSEHSVEL